MKVLCVCPIGIGNYLMFYPACRLLKRLKPAWSLHLLGLREGIREWARGDVLWDGVHVFDPTKMRGNPGAHLAVVAALRSQRFDLSLNFFPSNKWMYNILPLLAGIPRRLGFAYRYRPLSTLHFLLSGRVTVDHEAHDARNNVIMASYAADQEIPRSIEYEFPKLYDEHDVAWADGFLRAHGIHAGIAIHPGSSADHGMDAKRWAPQRFGELAERVCSETGCSAFVIGGPDEQELKDAVAGAMRGRSVIVEPVSLRRTAALLSRMRLALCNDSGLMHVASCLGVPTVGIFGPTDERRNAPMGARSLIVRLQMPGFPLWTSENVGNRVVPRGVDPAAPLKALSVDAAWEQVRPWLRKLPQN